MRALQILAHAPDGTLPEQRRKNASMNMFRTCARTSSCCSPWAQDRGNASVIALHRSEEELSSFLRGKTSSSADAGGGDRGAAAEAHNWSVVHDLKRKPENRSFWLLFSRSSFPVSRIKSVWNQGILVQVLFMQSVSKKTFLHSRLLLRPGRPGPSSLMSRIAALLCSAALGSSFPVPDAAPEFAERNIGSAFRNGPTNADGLVKQHFPPVGISRAEQQHGMVRPLPGR